MCWNFEKSVFFIRKMAVRDSLFVSCNRVALVMKTSNEKVMTLQSL